MKYAEDEGGGPIDGPPAAYWLVTFVGLLTVLIFATRCL